jgi:hypothetical protein
LDFVNIIIIIIIQFMVQTMVWCYPPWPLPCPPVLLEELTSLFLCRGCGYIQVFQFLRNGKNVYWHIKFLEQTTTGVCAIATDLLG